MEDLAKVSVVTAQPGAGPAGDSFVLVTITPPEGTQRTPSNIVCVIDVSWSMSMEAKVQTSKGGAESNGLSMLDIAKHAVKTIIRTLQPQDRIAIVDFCKTAKVLVPLTQMTDQGRAATEAALDKLEFGSGTDLWQGLSQGLDALRATAQDGRMGHIMLLTDGETEERGTVMSNLRKYAAAQGGLPGTVCAFGFGYEIDSDLLVEIADFTDGSYAFIPDAGLVGTCFVNSVANLLVTMGRGAVLSLEAKSGARILEVLGREGLKDPALQHAISLGNLQYGQAKDIVLRMNIEPGGEPYLHVALQYSTVRTQHKLELDMAPDAAQGGAAAAERLEPQRCRSILVDALRSVAAAANTGDQAALKRAQGILTDSMESMKASPMAATESIAGLLQDVQGQCAEAVSNLDYWTKWGRHFLPSVASAHALQQCNNFKDPGVQVYGGELFQDIRDAADTAFNSLPAPSITPAEYRYLGNQVIVRNHQHVVPGRPMSASHQAAPAAAAPVAMSDYNDRYGG